MLSAVAISANDLWKWPPRLNDISYILEEVINYCRVSNS